MCRKRYSNLLLVRMYTSTATAKDNIESPQESESRSTTPPNHPTPGNLQNEMKSAFERTICSLKLLHLNSQYIRCEISPDTCQLTTG